MRRYAVVFERTIEATVEVNAPNKATAPRRDLQHPTYRIKSMAGEKPSKPAGCDPSYAVALWQQPVYREIHKRSRGSARDEARHRLRLGSL
jgi:hypothetical protein